MLGFIVQFPFRNFSLAISLYSWNVAIRMHAWHYYRSSSPVCYPVFVEPFGVAAIRKLFIRILSLQQTYRTKHFVLREIEKVGKSPRGQQQNRIAYEILRF